MVSAAISRACPRRRPKARRAFTLLELLVVIAIIAVLVAILAPTISTLGDFLQEIVCANNVRQLGHGMLSYVSENKRFAPWRKTIIGWWNQGNPSRLRRSYIFPHMDCNEDVFVCPKFQEFAGGRATFSYTMNWNIGYGNEYNSEQLQHLGMIEQPTELAIFCEENPWIHPVYANYTVNDGQMVTPDWPYRDTFATFHRPIWDRYVNGHPAYLPRTDVEAQYNAGISNVAFVDGHVSWRTSIQTERDCHNNPNLINFPQNN